jgi:hypothetical protein
MAEEFKNSKEIDEIEKMKEWQDHQYDPGHWTGGRMPHFIFKPKYKKFLLFYALVVAIIFMIAYL